MMFANYLFSHIGTDDRCISVRQGGILTINWVIKKVYQTVIRIASISELVLEICPIFGALIAIADIRQAGKRVTSHLF